MGVMGSLGEAVGILVGTPYKLFSTPVCSPPSPPLPPLPSSLFSLLPPSFLSPSPLSSSSSSLPPLSPLPPSYLPSSSLPPLPPSLPPLSPVPPLPPLPPSYLPPSSLSSPSSPSLAVGRDLLLYSPLAGTTHSPLASTSTLSNISLLLALSVQCRW